MGDLSVRIPSRGSLEEAFSEMPPGLRSFLSEGFIILSKLTREKVGELVPFVLESVQSGSGSDYKNLATQLDMERKDARLLLGSMTLLASMLSGREDTVQQFIKSAVDARIVNPEATGVATTLFEGLVADRAVLRQAMTRSSVSSEVLPSLLEFESTVDLRLGFDKFKVSFAVPVALLHLDTDASGQEVWLQVTRKQLENMIKDLEETLRKVVEAEKWANSKPLAKEQ